MSTRTLQRRTREPMRPRLLRSATVRRSVVRQLASPEDVSTGCGQGPRGAACLGQSLLFATGARVICKRVKSCSLNAMRSLRLVSRETGKPVAEGARWRLCRARCHALLSPRIRRFGAPQKIGMAIRFDGRSSRIGVRPPLGVIRHNLSWNFSLATPAE